MKKILVVSHERSGTHFLINTIAKNFGYDNYQIETTARDALNASKEEVEQYKSQVRAMITKNFQSNTKRIFKSHHQYDFFREYISEVFRHFHIFYIVRDVRDVLTSCFFYFNGAATKAFPKPKTVKELAFDIKPYKFSFDGAYSLVKSEDFVGRWIRHVSDWTSSGACVITYEDLKTNFERVLNQISRELGRKALSAHVPTLRDRAVSPRKGIIGDWVSHLPPEISHKIHKRIKADGLVHFMR
jgi:hypothetical protein